MKAFYLLILLFSAGLVLSAQVQGPLSKINRQMADLFAKNPVEKIFITTNKTLYKPGETIWFRAFVTGSNNQPSSKGRSELIVKLYDSNGKSEIQQLFKLNNGSSACDLTLPKELVAGIYFLCVYTSSTEIPEGISVTTLRIDPDYNNQWIFETSLKDSISIAGQQNEINSVLRDLSGEIQKNTGLRYQLLNGTEIIGKGKIKTNDQGKLKLPFTLPAKTNGGPFILVLSDNGEELKSEQFLPSNLDTVQIEFYPEGGTIIPGTVSKVGFTAYNKWGMPVEVEGDIHNQDDQFVARVRTFAPGLGMFTLNNGGDQKYKLAISGKTGQNQTFKIPDPNPAGLSLSIAKNDAQFVTANLVFADKTKHTITLTMTQGSNLSWAADLEVNQNGRIKIPVDSIPHGINLLTAFSAEGSLLAERIVFIDKKQELKIEILPERNSLATGESMKVKVRMTDEKNQPVSGSMSITVTDQYRMDVAKPQIDQALLVNSGLENPFSLISGALKGKIAQSILLDVYLIGNRMTSYHWPALLNPNSMVPQTVSVARKSVPENKDTRLSAYIEGYAQKYRFLSKKSLGIAGYYTNNEGLFPKAPKVYKQNTIALDNQRRMFQSSSSILDVIKTIKPYKIQNGMIVFVGSENSFNYQGGALIILDGQILGTDVSQLASINPSDVDHINVSTNAMDIQRYTGMNSVGIIEIWQKRAAPADAASVSESTEKYGQGYRIPGIFPAAPASAIRDTRTTLLWIPEQTVDATGQVEFTVTAGAVYSDFVVEAQGISDNGRVGSGKAVFKVGK